MNSRRRKVRCRAEARQKGSLNGPGPEPILWKGRNITSEVRQAGTAGRKKSYAQLRHDAMDGEI